MRCTLQLRLNARSTTEGHSRRSRNPQMTTSTKNPKLPPRPDRQSLPLTTIPTTGPPTTDHRPSHPPSIHQSAMFSRTPHVLSTLKSPLRQTTQVFHIH